MSKRNARSNGNGKKNPDQQVEEPNSPFSEEVESNNCNPRPATIVIAGTARLPENVTAKQALGCVTVELEVGITDATIVDISCTLVPALGEKIIRKALLGNKIDEGIEEAITQLDSRFFNVTKKAAMAALEDVYRCYKRSLKKIADRDT